MLNSFTREDTKITKGIAILLMIMHHLWAFPERITGVGLLNGIAGPIVLYLGVFGKICVSLFMFLGGYGMYHNFQNRKFDIISKIKGLYISYWKVFLVFIPIGFIFFSKQPIYATYSNICTVFNQFNLREFLDNFFAINITYNGEWWFLTSYFIAICSAPIFFNIIEKNSLSKNVAIIIIYTILTSEVFTKLGELEILGNLNDNFLYKMFICQYAPFISCFIIGAICAKENLLVKLKDTLMQNNLLNGVVDIIGIGIIVYLRNTGIGEISDVFIVPFFVVFILDLCKKSKMVCLFFHY